jgi:hypothetical protein
MTSTTRTLERLEQQAQQRQQAQPVQLPAWSDSKRAAPSAAFRSALFPALGRVKRKKLWDEPIFSVAGLSVTFRGEQLDQTDLDVYLELLHRLRDQSSEVEFTAYGILNALDRPIGSSGYVWLNAVIKRLTSGTIDLIGDDDRTYSGHLIEASERQGKAYSVSVNQKFAKFFRSGWSSLDSNQRRALATPTAKALHAYYSSHRKPGFHLWTTLAGIVGTTDSNQRRAQQRLKTALDDLVSVGFLTAWTPTQDGVEVALCVDNLLA